MHCALCAMPLTAQIYCGIKANLTTNPSLLESLDMVALAIVAIDAVNIVFSPFSFRSSAPERKVLQALPARPFDFRATPGHRADTSVTGIACQEDVPARHWNEKG